MEILKHKLDIQFFAEEDPAGTQESETELTLDDLMAKFKPEDILSHSSMKSALDSQIGKATDTAIKNARARWEKEKDESLSEAEKLAKMTKDERERYQFKKDQESFAAEKAKFEKEKLIVATGNELNGMNIDSSLAELIVGNDADETKKRLETFTKAFNGAVEKAIDSKLKGGSTMKKAQENDSDLDAEIKKYMGIK